MGFDIHNPSTRVGQIVVTRLRKIYNKIGFKKGYNFWFFCITVGAMMGFVLARFSYTDIDGVYIKHGVPGEQIYYGKGSKHYQRYGLHIHIAGGCVSMFLVCFQFVPWIRYNYMIFHRLNGYVTLVAILMCNAGLLMVVDIAFGGDPITRVTLSCLAALSTATLFLAWLNIQRLQIDQHRIWMLRTWSWLGCIITLRIILIGVDSIVLKWYNFYTPIKCSTIWFMYKYYANVPDAYNPAQFRYPECTSPNSTHWVAVPTSAPEGQFYGPEQATALIAHTFGLCSVVSWIINAILCEIYLGLTPGESARLRQVSYERQLKAGYFKHPEKGFLTATRLGDAPEGWNGPNAACLPTAPGAITEKNLSSDSSGSGSDDEMVHPQRPAAAAFV